MNESKETPHQYREGLFTAISVGFFLLLVGTLFVITPNLFDKILDFFKGFDLVDVPNTDITFIAPEFPNSHSLVYQAARQFSIALGVFQIVILALRFVIPSLEANQPCGKTCQSFCFTGKTKVWSPALSPTAEN